MVQVVKESAANYDSGLKLFGKKRYLGAVEALKKVSSKDSNNFEQAKVKIEL